MLQISVFNQQQHLQRCLDGSTLTLGSFPSDSSQAHFQIDDDLVAGTQCRIELVDRGDINKLVISNLGRCIVLEDGNRLHQGVCEEVDLPCSIYAGDTQIEISVPAAEFNNENLKKIPLFGTRDAEDMFTSQDRSLSPAPATLNSWFESLSQMNRAPASDSSFFKMAARAVFNPGGLDGCIILKRNHEDWEIVAQHLPYPDYGISYRSELVDEAAETASILYHRSISKEDAESLTQQHSAIACPVRNADDQITAMVYGFRCNHRRNNRFGIRDLEAKFVCLIADAVSAGMIRLSQEASGARRRVLLQQAFSPVVAERLENNPDFPIVENREVSVLFADIRSFCKITEYLGCHLTYHLMSDVMNNFTEIIHRHNGVVIDYYGDGISAFWNAPEDQPDHPLLACRAGLEITQSLKELNSKWINEIGRQLRVGVGITTGGAQIGNSGSSFRLKYGPQGTTVNIANRLEQSTKKTGVSLVVSGQTAQRVESEYVSNRICTATFSGINQTVEIMQLVCHQEIEDHQELFSQYQQALAMYESQDFFDAIQFLLDMFEDFPQQPIVEFLLKLCVEKLSDSEHDNNLVKMAIKHLGTAPLLAPERSNKIVL